MYLPYALLSLTSLCCSLDLSVLATDTQFEKGGVQETLLKEDIRIKKNQDKEYLINFPNVHNNIVNHSTIRDDTTHTGNIFIKLRYHTTEATVVPRCLWCRNSWRWGNEQPPIIYYPSFLRPPLPPPRAPEIIVINNVLPAQQHVREIHYPHPVPQIVPQVDYPIFHRQYPVPQVHYPQQKIAPCSWC